MSRLALLLLLAGCAREDPKGGPRTVAVYKIEVALNVDPDPGHVQVEDPAWLQMAHCGALTLDGDQLIAQGGLPQGVEGVALLRYKSWGSLFSGGGTTELELDITDGADVRAGLDTDRVLYQLYPDSPDSGVPGGERAWTYPARDLPVGTEATETHTRFPMVQAEVVDAEVMACMR